jgi:hypothetical protein
MLVAAPVIQEWMGDVPGSQPDIGRLTLYFVMLYLLMATQVGLIYTPSAV